MCLPSFLPKAATSKTGSQPCLPTSTSPFGFTKPRKLKLPLMLYRSGENGGMFSFQCVLCTYDVYTTFCTGMITSILCKITPPRTDFQRSVTSATSKIAISSDTFSNSPRRDLKLLVGSTRALKVGPGHVQGGASKGERADRYNK